MDGVSPVVAMLAVGESDIIGRGTGLPWHLPGDLKRFRRFTTGSAIIMGRLTYQSIVLRNGRPLPGRHTVVVSATLRLPVHPNVTVAPNVTQAINRGRALTRPGQPVYVVGGARVFAEALGSCDALEVTRVRGHVTGDVVMPPGWTDGFAVQSITCPEPDPGATHPYRYERYVRV